MELQYSTYLLQFKHPFGVSSNTRKETPAVFVRLGAQGQWGYGEACLPAYLGETTEETIAFFQKIRSRFEKIPADEPIGEILKIVDGLSHGNNAAKAAIDIALHDLAGKREERPYFEMMGFKKSEPRFTSFTIGIDSEDVVIRKIREAEEFKVFKIKAGSTDDKKLIGLVRKHTDKPLYVDVNQGWTDKFFVLDVLHWMQDKGVDLVEQPMPVSMKKEMAWVTERSPIITIADESVKRLKDLELLEGSFSGVNIKLMKCTGLNEALEMIAFCKKSKLKILLGCMAESSCATSAMAQLMQFADYIDLDAPQLYTNDPFKGVTYAHGKVCLSDGPGIGVDPIKSLLNF